MDGVSGHRTRVADYEGWVGIRGVCGCLPCSLCILGHLCGSLDLISTRFECLGVIMFFRKICLRRKEGVTRIRESKRRRPDDHERISQFPLTKTVGIVTPITAVCLDPPGDATTKTR